MIERLTMILVRAGTERELRCAIDYRPSSTLLRQTGSTHKGEDHFNDGSQPGTRTFLYIRPTQGIIIALMTNMEGAWCEELVQQILLSVEQCRGTRPAGETGIRMRE